MTVVPLRGPTQRVRVVVLEPERRLVTELRVPGARMSFHYEIEPTSGGSAIRHRVGMDGPLAALYGLVMRDNNRRKLEAETVSLAAAAALKA